MTSSTIGIQIGASTPPNQMLAVVTEAERLGYGEIWLAENYCELGGVASVMAALAATKEIPVGLGVVAAAVRNPAVTAMEFATVAGFYPDRFMAGIGHGAARWLQQMGIAPKSPLNLLREATDVTRRLLQGEEVTQQGDHYQLEGVRLLHPPDRPVPIYLGVHGPASLRLSGELGDGTLLGWLSSPGYVAWARQRIDEGRARVGRRGPHELVVLCLQSMSENDPIAARRKLGRFIGPMLANMADSPQVTMSVAGEELAALVGVNDSAIVANVLPDELLDEFVVAGDAARCATTVNRLLEAGADRVVLVPNPAGIRSTDGMVGQIQAASVLL